MSQNPKNVSFLSLSLCHISQEYKVIPINLFMYQYNICIIISLTYNLRYGKYIFWMKIIIFFKMVQNF